MATGRAPYLARQSTPNGEFFTGSFAPNGTSDPSTTTIGGVGFSVVYTSTGKWTVTLKGVVVSNPPPFESAVIRHNASPTNSWDIDILAGYDTTTSPGDTIFVIAYRENATLANPTAHANTRVSFCIQVQP